MLLGQAVQLAAQKADWKVGIQTWTFHNLTLMETLDKTQQLGMGYAEAFFFQELGAPFPKETYLNYDLSDDDCALLRHEFKKRGIKPIAFGVASYGTNEEWDKFFAFAHKIGAHIVTVEPELNQLDYIESLAKKYDMEVAIHNHPSPCIYASAEVVEKALKGRSPLMGVCADIGHWKRVGEDQESPEIIRTHQGGAFERPHRQDGRRHMGNRDLTGKSVRQRAEASAFQRAYLH